MPQQLLDRPNVRSALEQRRGKRVAELRWKRTYRRTQSQYVRSVRIE